MSAPVTLIRLAFRALSHRKRAVQGVAQVDSCRDGQFQMGHNNPVEYGPLVSGEVSNRFQGSPYDTRGHSVTRDTLDEYYRRVGAGQGANAPSYRRDLFGGLRLGCVGHNGRSSVFGGVTVADLTVESMTPPGAP